MKAKRIVRVTGVQQNAEGEKSTIELFTEGVFYIKNGNYYIVYEESEVSGMEGATTSLKIEDNKKISMKRFGTSTTNFDFEKNKHFEASYMTMYGDLTINIITNTLNIEIDGDTGKGNIEIDYDLRILGDIKTSNKLKIQLM